MDYNWGKTDSPWLYGDAKCWEELFFEAKKNTVKKNTVLFHEGDKAERIYMVLKGRIRISSYLKDGNEKQLFIAEVGSIFGERGCISNGFYLSTASTIVTSEVLSITVDQFWSQLQKNPSLTKHMLKFEIRKSNIFQQQVLSLAFSSAASRIARTLVDLCQLYGEETVHGHCLRIRFTKNDIAGMVGTSRVTASSELTKMEQNGLLIRHDNYYMITDIEKLKILADYD